MSASASSGGAASLRLAWVSPLPPQRSGIADYSAELMPRVAERLAVEGYVEDRVVEACRAESAASATPVPLRPLSDLTGRVAAGEHDAVLYHLGNDPRFHGAIYRRLLETPGILVLHEYVLHHLIVGITLASGDGGDYLDTMRYCYGPTGEAAARRTLATGVPVDPWAYPLFERAVDASLGVIVHSEASRRRVLASRPAARVAVVPHHLSLAAPASPAEDGADRPAGNAAAARRELGLPADVPVIAAFGFMTPHKRLDVALAAFAEVRRRRPEARFLVAGEVAADVDLERLLAGERGAGVTVTGRLALGPFLAAMRACDVAVNLRYPTGGETSGTLMRLLGLGKAVVVSDHGSFAELPAGCAAKVEIDDDEPEILGEILCRLVEDEPLRRALGANAARYMAERHTIEGSAAAYARFVEETAAAAEPVAEPVPPLAPFPKTDLETAVVAELGRDLFDLGIDERDGALLAGVAETLVELGLGAPAGRPARSVEVASAGRRRGER